MTVNLCLHCEYNNIDLVFMNTFDKTTAYLLQKDQEGDVGAQCGCQRPLTGNQVETFGCLDGTLMSPGCVLHTDSSCTVIGDYFPVAGREWQECLLTSTECEEVTALMLCRRCPCLY